MAHPEQPSSLETVTRSARPNVGHSIPSGVFKTLKARFASARLGFLLAMSAPLLGNGECTTDDDDSAEIDLAEAYAAYCAEHPAQCDADSDGFNGDGECDDFDPNTHPGATEFPYDGIDQDCNGEDETDVDGDGVSSDEVEGGTDCDDGNPGVHPGALEVCDGDDQDCDEEVDEAGDLASGEGNVWGFDLNGDSLCGDGEPLILSCTSPEAIEIELSDGQTITIPYVACEEESK